MIITQAKPTSEVLSYLEGVKKVLVTGCGECASVCKTGGAEEIEAMAELLKQNGIEVVATLLPQNSCNYLVMKKELKQFKDLGYEAIVCMACGDGVQTVSSLVDSAVYPANNTMFLGEIERLTKFSEACHMCGDCMLANTGGICPITKCAKSLINGPCGGSRNGMCEVNPENPCAWVEIYNRMKKLNQTDKLLKINEPKSYKNVAYPRVIDLKQKEVKADE